MSFGITRTGVAAHFSAAHRDAEGRLHGHTWRVRAWFAAGPDALALQGALKEALLAFDHQLLPDELSRGEAIAETLGLRLPECVAVEVSRDAEALYAMWQAEPSPIGTPQFGG